MRTTAVRSAGWPRPARWALIGAAGTGGFGTIVGAIVGLFVYAPTAAFAGVELGIPSTVVGAILGATAGAMAPVGRRFSRNRPPSG